VWQDLAVLFDSIGVLAHALQRVTGTRIAVPFDRVEVVP